MGELNAFDDRRAKSNLVAKENSPTMQGRQYSQPNITPVREFEGTMDNVAQQNALNMIEGMERVVGVYQKTKENLEQYGDGDLGLTPAQAEEFEYANAVKRISHAQPFTDKEIKDAFFTFDMSGNGFLAAGEIRFVLDALGENVTDEEIDEMIRMIDADGDG